eukprot:SAG31_NODE_29758_length_390_cov_0.879725_1_plen_121_part_01
MVDRDRSGSINYDEFAKYLVRQDDSLADLGVRGSKQKPIGRKRLVPKTSDHPEGEGPIASSRRPVLSHEQQQKLQRLARILDVFSAFDSVHGGKLKDHELAIGFSENFGMKIGAADAKKLL